VKIPAGWRVTLYQHAGFNGASKVLTSDTPALPDFNDQTSSIVVEGGSTASEPSKKVALRASNGQYVCAEGSGGREVVANRNAIGPWETFTVIEGGNGHVALQANNGQYVCAEGSGGREVVANRNAIGAWETFTLMRL
jgi:hypothetical protein